MDRSPKRFASVPTPAWAVLFVGAWLSALLCTTARDQLPDRFSNDGYLIQQVAQERNPFPLDRSYENAAAAYRLLGLQDTDELTALFGCAALLITLAVALTFGRQEAFRFRHLYISVIAIVLGGVFLSWYNKDVFALAPVLVALLVLKYDYRRWWVIIVAMAGYAAIFRTYWYLIAAAALAFTLVGSRGADSARGYLLRMFLSSQVFLAFFCFAFPLVTGNPADSFRSVVNSTREGAADAVTIITPLFGGDSSLVAYLNAALVQVTLIFPWPLAAEGPQYVVYAAVILSVWLCILVAVLRKWETSSAPDRARMHVGFSIIWACLTVQAIFEPDYGSYLRHLTPILPLMLAIALMAAAGPPTARSTLAVVSSRTP